MKKIFTFILVFTLLFTACKNENSDKTYTPGKQTGKVIKYINYDDELDVKSTATIDTIEFRKQMNQILPNKRILELFGAGYQIFYLALDIYDDDKKSYFQLSPEAGSWVSGYQNINRALLKENIELSDDFAIVPRNNDDSKAVNLTSIFGVFSWAGGFSNTSPGQINNKKVNSRKTYQIDISIDNSGKIIKPWTIKEIDRNKFKPVIKNNLVDQLYRGIFPAILKDDYKSLKDKIIFPQEAITREVNGKVLVKLFFEKDGSFSGYQLIKGLGYGCEEAVINALKDYPIESYPSGERTSLVLPFSFGPSKNKPVDVYVKSFEYSPTAKHNQLELTLKNKYPPVYYSKIKYSVYVFLNDKLIFSDYNASLGWDSEVGPKYWIGGNKIKSGTYEYRISIDPEGVLNDVDRSNNIVRGKLFIK